MTVVKFVSSFETFYQFALFWWYSLNNAHLCAGNRCIFAGVVEVYRTLRSWSYAFTYLFQHLDKQGRQLDQDVSKSRVLNSAPCLFGVSEKEEVAAADHDY